MQYAETPIQDAFEIIQSIPCPDEKHACPDGNTCCQSDDGRYGCCRAYRVAHKYLNDFFEKGCGIQMSQATPTKSSMLFKHTYSKLF